MPVEAGLLSIATMLFNRPIRGLLPQVSRGPINVDNDDPHCKVYRPTKEN